MKFWDKLFGNANRSMSNKTQHAVHVKWTKEDEARLANSLRYDDLFRELRRMNTAGEDFFHDGFWTTIRLINLTPMVEERLAKAFYDLLVKYRRNAMEIGFLLVWEGYFVSEADSSRYYLVVTLEGFCPKNREDFDRVILETA
jgi:hypothetical protein